MARVELTEERTSLSLAGDGLEERHFDLRAEHEPILPDDHSLWHF
jgi:hypothetical protein